jgi:triosephosphate isomerase
MRIPLVAGNWKMFTTASTARRLAVEVVRALGKEDRVTVALCPPFPYLSVVGEALRGSPVQLGAQNLYPEKEGAFTGEVSPVMLRDLGCRYVILGHSERRHKLGESNSFINRKVRAALECDLNVILCVGETLEEREHGRTEAILEEQLSAGLAGLSIQALSQITLAYEPVWAIGTGRNATPEQAEHAHAFLRRRVGQLYSPLVADSLCVQYGGSVKPENAAVLMREPDVDGALVGGASLKADQFMAIVQAALPKS